MYKNILFDLDGTIFNTEPGVTRCIRFAVMQHGLPEPSMDQLRACIGPPLTDCLRSVIGVPEDMVNDVIKTFRAEYDSRGKFECKMYDGVLELIKSVHEDGCYIALTSSKNENACIDILRHFDLYQYFDDIIGSSISEKREHKIDVLNEFFYRHSIAKKSETILIGDTHFDVEGANLCGIDSIGVTYGFGSREEHKQYKATYIYDTADEVREFLHEN